MNCRLLLLTLLSVLAVTACGGKKETAITVESVTVTPGSISLHPDQEQQLAAEVVPAKASYDKIEWTSSNPIVAAVSADGLVTAVSFGEATVRATAGGVSGTCIVSVVPVEVESVTVTPASATLTVGETASLSAGVLPADATDRTVQWSSSDEAVATVSAEGVVTAVAPGDAVISATASNGVKGECAVCCKAPFSFSVERYDRASDAWTDAASGIFGYPGDSVSVRLAIVEGDGITFEWQASPAESARYADGAVYLLAPGDAVLTVTASDGKELQVPLCSNISPSFSFGSGSYQFGSIIPVGSSASTVVAVSYSDGARILPMLTDTYSVYSESSLVAVALAEEGWKVSAMGEAGDALLKLRIGEWVDMELCTVRVAGKYSSTTESLDGEEKFEW